MMDAFGRDPTFARVVSGSGWLIGGTAVATAAAFVQSALVARHLGPAGFGLLGLTLVLVTVARQLLSSRVWEAATKFVVEYRQRNDPVRAGAALKLCYLIDVATGVVALAVVMATSSLAAHHLLKDPDGMALIRLYAFSSLILAPRDPAVALLRVAGAYRWLAAEMVGEAILHLGGVLYVVLATGAGVRAFLWVLLLCSTAGTAALLVMARQAGRSLGLPAWRDAPLGALRGELRPILKFMVYTNLTGTTRLITGYADVLFLGALVVPHTVGLYRLAVTLSYPIAALSQPVYQVVFPEMAKLVAARQRASVLSLERRLRDLAAAVVLPVCILTTVLAGWAVPLVFGAEFAGSVPLVRIMVWQLVAIPFMWVPGLLLAMGHARRATVLATIDAAAYLVLLAALVPPFHAVGAAVATLDRFVVWTILAIGFSRRANREMAEAWEDSAHGRPGEELQATPR
jgi:O-antigen/teichoic acid export membrane protein